MTEQFPIDPGHQRPRDLFRKLGIPLACLGGLLLAIGILDFMLKFGSMETPTLFIFCPLPGMILLGIGMGMTKAGYAGRIARYYSQEITPVATDTFNHAADRTKDSIRELAGAVGAGIGEAIAGRDATPGDAVRIRCHKCNHENDAMAKFCSQCGTALAKSVPCPGCGELNDPDARFCDHCGLALA